MKDIIFKNEEHKKFYYEKIGLLDEEYQDVYNKTLFYCLGIFSDSRKMFSSIYNIEERQIIPSVLNEGWLTGSTTRCLRIAFNLFNGFTYDIDKDGNIIDRPNLYTLEKLLGYDSLEFYFQAISLRYMS